MKWTLLLFLGCMACSKPYTLTASLNNSRWFGSGEATEIHTKENQTCLLDRFSLIIRTDLPFDKSTPEIDSKKTGCVGPCTLTQVLGFYHIPLEKGIHNLALPDTCLPTKNARSFDSFKIGGKATLHILDPEAGRAKMYYEFSEGDQGWVKITKLNRATGNVQGRFDVTLTGVDGQSIHFKKGKFRSRLVTQ
jgi:hypothetical protein